MSSVQQPGFTVADTSVWLGAESSSTIRYASGLTLYEEALLGGRFVGRYWSATGAIKPTRHLDDDRPLLSSLPTAAFTLRIDDQVLDGNWLWAGASEQSEPAGSSRHAVVELRQQSHPLRVKVHTRFDGSPFLVRGLEISNNADHAVAVREVSPFAGLLWLTRNYQECVPEGAAVFTLGYFKGSQPLEEGDVIWQPLPAGTTIVENRMGRSGHSRPAFMVRNEANGETFIVELGWSSNWRFSLTVSYRDQEGAACLSAAIGPYAIDPVWRVIDPGETISTPDVHIGHLHGDLDCCVQALHRHIRTAVLPPQLPGKAQLVEANHRGYLVDHEDEAGILREIEIAASVGAEIFTIDAGWYGREPNRWWQNVGDWQAGPWLPNDLFPLIERAHQRGMLFGLWVEIESIGANTALREAHPQWVLTRHGEEIGGGRHLDIANPEVASWIEAEFVRLISVYGLDLIRLDYNTYCYDGGTRHYGGFVENTLWRHVEAVWGIFERLRRRFPTLIFETCASGGGRLDLGMLRYFQITEATDWMPAPRSLKIFNGLSTHLPPEICLRTFGTEVQDHYLFGDIDFQLRSCLFGQPILRGIAPTLEELGAARKAHISHALDLYKRVIRPLLPTVRVYHHTPTLPLHEAQPWCVLEYAAPDGDREVAGIFRLTAPHSGRYTYHPRGLRSGVTYRVTFDNSGDSFERLGFELQRDGIGVVLESALTSELLTIERVA